MSAINTTTDTLGLGSSPDAPLDIKAVHQRGFKWLMVLLFAVFCVTTVMVLGLTFSTGPLGLCLELWAALLLAPLMGYRLTQIYRWATRNHRLRKSLSPGNVTCPHCGSLQTDLSERMVQEKVSTFRVCFRCDHEWAR